jgi:PHD/YefM family antitoxin component YafN of YafNO toxin-antitoxin module
VAVTILPASEVRDRMAAVLKQLSETGQPVFITRYSRAEAVLLSMERYGTMMDLLEDREDELDSALGRRVLREREAHARGEGREFDAFVAGLE